MFENPSDDALRELLLACGHIAVVGLSPKPFRDSHGVAAYMQRHGYTITGVNPGHDTLLGEPCYPSLAAIPPERPVEIVDIFRRSEEVGPHVDEASARGARAVWMQFGVIDEAAAARARVAGLVVVMDLCLKIEHRRLVGG